MDEELKRILNKLLDIYFKERSEGLLEWMRKLDNYLIEQAKTANPVENRVMLKIAEMVEKYGLECPSSSNCRNRGTLAEHGCNGTEEDCVRTCPIPVQCEFCYCEPKSKFNLENDLKEKFASNFSA